MTVAVLARVPWGEHGRMLRSRPGSTQGYDLIFAADTRFSFEASNQPFDYGQKVWRLSSTDIGAVFAGDVWTAEEGLERLKQAIVRECPLNGTGDLPRIAQREFSKVYAAHIKKRTKKTPGPVYYLLGARYPTGQSDCVYLSYSNDFAPLFVAGVNAIGWRSACEAFSRNLDIATRENLSQGTITSDPLQWGMQLVPAMSSVVEDVTESSVGGGVQWATMDEAGWTTTSIDLSDDGENWKNITRTPTELERYKRRWRVPCLSDGSPDLGLFHICD
jgi:hypothetical protein